MNVIMNCIPRNQYSYKTPEVFTCSISFLFNCILLSTIALDSWLAVIFWFVSGIVVFFQSLMKFDLVWCIFFSQYSGHPTVLAEESLISVGPSLTPSSRIDDVYRWHIDSSDSECEEYQEVNIITLTFVAFSFFCSSTIKKKILLLILSLHLKYFIEVSWRRHYWRMDDWLSTWS